MDPKLCTNPETCCMCYMYFVLALSSLWFLELASTFTMQNNNYDVRQLIFHQKSDHLMENVQQKRCLQVSIERLNNFVHWLVISAWANYCSFFYVSECRSAASYAETRTVYKSIYVDDNEFLELIFFSNGYNSFISGSSRKKMSSINHGTRKKHASNRFLEQ